MASTISVEDCDPVFSLETVLPEDNDIIPKVPLFGRKRAMLPSSVYAL